MSAQCITPNPDIAGIGVRVSIYTQALLSLAHPIIAAYDSRVTLGEIKSLHGLYMSILLTACALLVSTIISAKTSGLDVYHALIVLNLSWINNATVLTFLPYACTAFYQRYSVKYFRTERHPRDRASREDVESSSSVSEKEGRYSSGTLPLATVAQPPLQDGATPIEELNMQEASGVVPLSRTDSESRATTARSKNVLDNHDDTPQATISTVAEFFLHTFVLIDSVVSPVVLASAHLAIVSGIGIWVWRNIETFGGSQAGCTPFTVMTLMFPNWNVNVTTSRILRKTSLVVYMIGAIPIFNLLCLTVVCMMVLAIATLPLLIITFVLKKRRLAIARWKRLGYRPSNPGFIGYLKAARDEAFEGARSGRKADIIQWTAMEPFLFTATTASLLLQLYFIICTELMIKKNAPLLIVGNTKESDWSFGQTLAMLLIALEMVEIARFLKEKRGKGITDILVDKIARWLGISAKQMEGARKKEKKGEK